MKQESNAATSVPQLNLLRVGKFENIHRFPLKSEQKQIIFSVEILYQSCKAVG